MKTLVLACSFAFAAFSTTHGHDHKHGDDCGHATVVHEGHVDFLHDGHMHHMDGKKISEHRFAINNEHPAHEHKVDEHGHKHAKDCGHERVPHGDHYDYAHDGHLHHVHGDHSDDHGKVSLSR